MKNLIASALAAAMLFMGNPVTEGDAAAGTLLSHRQETWRAALEWCESRGDPGAVNPKDRDGTPSYYSFQFKPSTFKSFGERYGIIEKGLEIQEIKERMKDYQITLKIVEAMILDQKNINWENEFPGCVKKLGRPPKN